jgi:hypothetical protein
MNTTTRRPRQAGAADPSARREDPRRFASRAKRWSLGIAVAGFGVTWGLVSQHVVGATNAAAPAGTSSASGTSGRAAVPSTDFFGQAGAQPQPILGSGGTGQGRGAIVSGRTS